MTCLGYVFSEIQATVELHQGFWLIQIDLCLDLELRMGNYLRIVLVELKEQNKICLYVGHATL